jgi:hypothetical protein
MNISKLNRLIALLLNAIKKETKGSRVHTAIRWALKWLNDARIRLNNSDDIGARMCVQMAWNNVHAANTYKAIGA